MLPLLLTQLALATGMALGAPDSPPQAVPTVGPPLHAAVRVVPRPTTLHPRAVTAGPKDKTALDILNDTRPDLLGRGAARHCPPVTAVYVDGARRVAPAIDHGFSRATLYMAGDTVMIMLPPQVADALRTIPAQEVRDIQYVDCRANAAEAARNILYVLTR